MYSVNFAKIKINSHPWSLLSLLPEEVMVQEIPRGSGNSRFSSPRF